MGFVEGKVCERAKNGRKKEEEMKYCNKCNQSYGNKEKKCPKCGNKLIRVAY